MTSGQKELFLDDEPGFKLNYNHTADLPARLEAWLSDKVQLKKARINAIHLARKYNWAEECIKLKNRLENIN